MKPIVGSKRRVNPIPSNTPGSETGKLSMNLRQLESRRPRRPKQRFANSISGLGGPRSSTIGSRAQSALILLNRGLSTIFNYFSGRGGRSPLALTIPLALGLFQVNGFVSNRNDANQPRRWILPTDAAPKGDPASVPGPASIPYVIAARAFSRTNAAAEIHAVRASFDQWQSIPGTSLRFTGTEAALPNPDVNPNDGTNLVFWATENAFVNGGRDNLLGTLSLTYPRVDSDNRLLESDIVLNGIQFDWYTDFSVIESPSQFVESSVLHEIGHLIGLDHSPAGGATMFARGTSGIGTQAGLSSDEIAAARWLYPSPGSNRITGMIQGRIQASGNAVHGAVISAENASGNLISATVSRANGDYELPELPPGTYKIRVTPLDPPSAISLSRLVTGTDISREFQGADPLFSPADADAVCAPDQTNRLDFEVVGKTPSIRITRLNPPSAIGAPFTAINAPVILPPGIAGLSIGVYSPQPISEAAIFSITGNGISLTSFRRIRDVFPGSNPRLNLVTAMLAVSPDTEPGQRSFVLRDGGEIAYANGFLEIAPRQIDSNFDGLDDRFQRAYFPSFTGPEASPEADPDGDGMRNSDERIAGTDPTDPASVVRIERVTLTNAGTTVQWRSIPGKAYQVSVRTEFGPEPWHPLSSTLVAVEAMTEFKDIAATGTVRFYQVRIIP